jgi:tRNA threonylcarbamoyladenosine biosynthesis protein TsaE
MQIISRSLNHTLAIGRAISRNLQLGDIICLFGQLGSGKTVLTKGIAQGLGIKKEKIISPTFVLIREYKAKFPFYHFDLYRLKEPQDIFNLGYEDYLYNEGITVIEWADRLKYLLPREHLKVELFIKSNSQRLIKFRALGRRPKDLLEKVREDISS